MAGDLRNNTAEGRFELDLDEGLAFASYRLSHGVLTIVHTEIPPALRGRGVGSSFVRQVLDEARRQGLKVVPRCGFVRAFMANHPEYSDLRQ